MESEIRELLRSMGTEVPEPAAPPPGLRSRARRRRARNALAAGLASAVLVYGAAALASGVFDRRDVAVPAACDQDWTSETIAVNATPLVAVEVIASDDVWIAGQRPGGGNGSLGSAGLVMRHWDGTSWETASVSIDGASDFSVFSISAAASDDVWAAGSITHGESYESRRVEGLL
ncbi:MAG TPA: hypothetical protein VM841_01215, partial [Actinomycetota bacterium]|nr:hypothetical protein [Actinomycetota bacterium]